MQDEAEKKRKVVLTDHQKFRIGDMLREHLEEMEDIGFPKAAEILIGLWKVYRQDSPPDINQDHVKNIASAMGEEYYGYIKKKAATKPEELIQESLEELRNTVSKFDSMVNMVVEKVASLEDRVDNLNQFDMQRGDSFAELQRRLNGIQNQLPDMKGLIENAEVKINSLREDVITMDARVTFVEQNVDPVT